jgi:Zn-dependent protease
MGRIAGIPLGANWSVAVILVIIVDLLAAEVLPGASPHQSALAYWGTAVVVAVAFFGSLMAHELSHAVVARRNGVIVRSITLWMLGGVTELESEPTSPGAELRVALAGPATSVLTAGVCFGAAAAFSAAGGSRAAIAGAAWLGLMNGLLAVFNLLPGSPLDGGRVLRAILWRRSGDRRRANHSAATAGRVIGAILAVFGVAELFLYADVGGLWLILVGLFMASAATAEERASAAASALANVRVGDIMSRDPELAPDWVTVADFSHRISAYGTQTDFPVVSLSGKLSGIVSISQLGRVPAQQRADTRLGQLARPVPPQYLATADDPAGPLLLRRPLGDDLLAVVLADSRVVGLVATTDLQRQVRWRTLTGAGV